MLLRQTMIIALSLIIATGCNTDDADSSQRQPLMRNAGDVAPADWQPLPSAPALDAETRAARLRILGDTGEDPSRVKLWWAGVSTFIVAIGGHLVLLDAWEVVGVHKGYVPVSRDDLVALKPEAIFIGHGHFDHAADARYVASRTGAALVAGSSVCDAARADAAANPSARPFACLDLGTDAGNPAGTVFPVRVFRDLADIQIIKHSHSAADPASLLQGGMPLAYTPELIPFLLSLNTDVSETLSFLLTLPDDGGVGQPEGGTWAYHFRVGRFFLLWNDSTGEMPENDPQADAIRDAIRSLPECVDVHVEAARSTLFIPNHHDAWFPVIGGGAAAYETQWRAALNTLPQPPQLDYVRDPEDYLKVRSFTVNDPSGRGRERAGNDSWHWPGTPPTAISDPLSRLVTARPSRA